MGLWSVNKTARCFDPRIENSCSLIVHMMAVYCLMIVKSLNSARIKTL